jgi:hypothetical protein
LIKSIHLELLVIMCRAVWVGEHLEVADVTGDVSGDVSVGVGQEGGQLYLSWKIT